MLGMERRLLGHDHGGEGAGVIHMHGEHVPKEQRPCPLWDLRQDRAGPFSLLTPSYS